MEPIDLYAILGVHRKANHGAIQKAFRAMARKCHPDSGGDHEAFQKIQTAYSVLSDPKRRAKYDATGEIDERKPDNSFAEVVQVMSLALASVIASLAGKGRKADSEDVVSHVSKAIAKKVEELHSQRGGLETIRAFIADAADRFTTDDGQDNVIAEIMRANLAQIKKNLEALDHSLEVHKKGVELLKRFRYKHSKTRYAGMTFTNASTTSGIWMEM